MLRLMLRGVNSLVLCEREKLLSKQRLLGHHHHNPKPLEKDEEKVNNAATSIRWVMTYFAFIFKD